jgi:hypothetical protein
MNVCKTNMYRCEYAYIGIELANKGREVVVLEEVGKNVTSKLRRPPHDKGGDAIVAPRDNVVGCGVVNQLISLRKERCRHRLVCIHCTHRCGASAFPAPLHRCLIKAFTRKGNRKRAGSRELERGGGVWSGF